MVFYPHFYRFCGSICIEYAYLKPGIVVVVTQVCQKGHKTRKITLNIDEICVRHKLKSLVIYNSFDS